MAEVRGILQQSLAKKTWQQYQRVWERFQEFTRNTLLTPPSLPIPISAILLFLTHLHRSSLAPSTIRSAGSALGYLHKINSLPDPTTAFIVQKLLTGMSKGAQRDDIRLPITRGILHRLLGATIAMGLHSYKTTMLRALYLLLFHGFLRIGEATTSSGSTTSLLLSDVSTAATTARVTLRQFKHSRFPTRWNCKGTRI